MQSFIQISFSKQDGKTNSALIVAALMLWIDLFKDWKDPLNMFAVKRHSILLNQAHQHYLEYLKMASGGHLVPLKDLNCMIVIKSIIMNGIPLFTKLRYVQL